MGPKNESMPEKLKDKTECGLYWSIARCMFGKNWNQTKEEMLPSTDAYELKPKFRTREDTL